MIQLKNELPSMYCPGLVEIFLQCLTILKVARIKEPSDFR